MHDAAAIGHGGVVAGMCMRSPRRCEGRGRWPTSVGKMGSVGVSVRGNKAQLAFMLPASGVQWTECCVTVAHAPELEAQHAQGDQGTSLSRMAAYARMGEWGDLGLPMVWLHTRVRVMRPSSVPVSCEQEACNAPCGVAVSSARTERRPLIASLGKHRAHAWPCGDSCQFGAPVRLSGAQVRSGDRKSVV